MPGILKKRRTLSCSPKLSFAQKLVKQACRRVNRVNFDKIVKKRIITPLKDKPRNYIRLPSDTNSRESDSFLEVTDNTSLLHINNNQNIFEKILIPMKTINFDEIEVPDRSFLKKYYNSGRKRNNELNNSYVPWTDAFSIRHASDILLNVDYESLIQWLNVWSKKLDSIQQKTTSQPPSKKRRKYDSDEDDDYEVEHSKFEEMENTYVVHGPTGCGKTSLVKYCIKKCGFNSLELSVSDWRSSSVLKKTLSGAIENFAVRKHNDIRSMFSPRSRQLPKKTLIVIEDADIIFQVDNGFWSKLNSLRTESKIPIILTCTDETQVLRNLENFDTNHVLKFLSKPIDNVVEHLTHWFHGYTDINIDENFLYKIVKNSPMDIRKAVNTLQFYTMSNCYKNSLKTADDKFLNARLLAEYDTVIGMCNNLRKENVKNRWTSRILPNYDYGNDSNGKELIKKSDIEMTVFPSTNNDDIIYNDLVNIIKQKRPTIFDEIDELSKLKSLDMNDRRGVELDIPLAVYDCFWRIKNSSSSRSRIISTDEITVLQSIDKSFKNRMKDKRFKRRVLHPFSVVSEKYGKLDNNDRLECSITSYNSWPSYNNKLN